MDRRSRLAAAAATMLLLSCGATAALASQGPGAAPGTAGAATQTAMAITVYGLSAVIIVVGMIGALRRR